MDPLNGLSVFSRAAETLSFVEAGRQLGLSASAVGKAVARLEQRLGVRLLQRSTRHISLTAEGALFYERCRRILDELQDAELEITRTLDRPRGKLRVSMPVIGYRMLLPLLPGFVQRYPEVELELDFNDRLVDVIEEGVDVAIRSGPLIDSRLTARPLGPFRFLVVGSTTYIAQHGAPAIPADLHNHARLCYRFPSTGKLQEWVLDPQQPQYTIDSPAAMTCNNIEALICGADQGLGLAYLPDFLVRDALATGSIRTVLAPYVKHGGMFSVLWPSSRHLSPKLRVFVDFICARLLQ
jgi:DNA-binding transcriptional LysR family regulator